MCADCMEGWCCAQTTQGTLASALNAIRCPGPPKGCCSVTTRCNTHIPLHEIAPFVTETTINKLREQVGIERYYKEASDRLNLRCPDCRIVTDPDPDACAAMMCANCGAHFCWVCFQLFESKAEVYKHVPVAHNCDSVFPSQSIKAAGHMVVRQRSLGAYLRRLSPAVAQPLICSLESLLLDAGLPVAVDSWITTSGSTRFTSGGEVPPEKPKDNDAVDQTDTHSTVEYGQALVRNACSLNFTAVLQILSSGGSFSVEERENRFQWTTLMIASWCNEKAVLAELLKRQASVNACEAENKTALMLSAEAGHSGITQMLIDHAADTTLRNNNGLSALTVACHFNRPECVIALLAHRMDPNERVTGQHNTVLMHAAEAGYFDVVTALLNASASVDYRGVANATALMLGASKGHVRIVDALLGHSANPSLYDEGRRTALRSASFEGRAACVRRLCSCMDTADINIADNEGFAPIHVAAFYGHIAVITLLVEGKAHLDKPHGKTGRTALMIASERGHEELVSLLLVLGADKTLLDHGQRGALFWAHQSGLSDDIQARLR